MSPLPETPPDTPIVMTLVVRDEADIIRQNIEFHLARGIGHVIAIDNDSRDGTTEILEDYAKAGCLTLLREPAGTFRQEAWVNRMTAMARERFGACWVINNDADEFWRPPDGGGPGDFRSLLARARSRMIRCRRHNMVSAAGQIGTGDWPRRLVWRSKLGAPPPKEAELLSARRLRHPYFCYRLPQKVLVHTEGLVSVSKGAHAASYAQPVEPEDLDIEIFHFPVRSATEFVASVRNFHAALTQDASRPPGQSAKYLRWGRMLAEAGAAQVLADVFPTWGRLMLYQLAGRIAKDTRLRDDLAALSPTPRYMEGQ